ncbi:MAG: agmatine deiminase family protein [Muribaculaceae bacterium]|nr:agmatine deiminase family protein [Muribaculaceae bacterium]
MTSTINLLAEWQPHGAVMLAWPHSETDWAYMLDQVQECYRNIVAALLRAGEKVIILAPAAEAPVFNSPDVTVIHVATNDTWIRDYGPLTLADGTLLDFRFNAWGQKFASNFDNQTTRTLADLKAIQAPVECHKDFVLEGGSIESDGNGTILTTSCCLLAPNRNEPMTRDQIDSQLLRRLHARKILWVDCQPLPGDDTDGHVDTLARLAPMNSIFYCGTVNPAQLAEFTNADGQPYNLFELPMPDPITDPDDGSLLPATYANYLVTANAVLMPTYGQPLNDTRAMNTLRIVFADREIIPVDCRALIRQHGSLHCATMQVKPSAFSFL